jgi:hypothetical protein
MSRSRTQALPEAFIGQGQAGFRSLVLARREANWVIPFDSRRVAAGALHVYRPKSVAEIVAWHGARRVAFPKLLSHRIHAGVGLRSDLATDICACLERPDLKFAVAVPEADRATVAAIAPAGNVVAFAKLATSEAAAARIENEHTALRIVRPQLPSSVRAPEVLFRGVLGGVEALLMSPVIGGRCASSTRLKPEYVRALAALVRQDACERLGSLLPPVLPLDGEWSHLLPAASERLIPWRDMRVRTALVHGDFAPWNVTPDDSGMAAYDWEDALLDGVPFWDLWHFVVQSTALLNRWSPENLVEAAVRLRGSIGSAIRNYAHAASLPPDLAKPVLTAYLAASASVVGRHGGLDRPDRVRGLDLRARVLAALLEAWQ